MAICSDPLFIRTFHQKVCIWEFLKALHACICRLIYQFDSLVVTILEVVIALFENPYTF